MNKKQIQIKKCVMEELGFYLGWEEVHVQDVIEVLDNIKQEIIKDVPMTGSSSETLPQDGQDGEGGGAGCGGYITTRA